jgi:hypothetical protein
VKRRLSLAAIALAGTVAVLAGCGAAINTAPFNPASGTNHSSQPPNAELKGAILALGDAPTLTTTISLGTTANVLGPILTSLGATLTPAQVAVLAGGQLTVEVAAPKGKRIKDISRTDESAAYAFTMSANGTTYLSVRRLDKTLYLQVDAKDLFTLVGQAGRYAGLEAKSATLPTFVQALLTDKWVSVPDATLSLLKSLQGRGFGAAPSPTPSSRELPNLVSELATIFTRDVTVTRLSAGSTDRLQVTANSRVIAAALRGLLAAARPGAPQGRPLTRPGRLPNGNVTVLANVVHGALSELSVNLGQYVTHRTVNVPLDVTFVRSGATISAPSGAVAVDTVGLIGLFGLLSGPGGGAGAGLPGSNVPGGGPLGGGLLGGLTGATST